MAKTIFQRMLDLSTGHLSEQLNNHLSGGHNYAPFRYIGYEYGYVLWPTDPSDDPEDDIKQAFWAEFPELKAIMQFAYDSNCFLVKFDADADEYDQFPIFEWSGDKSESSYQQYLNNLYDTYSADEAYEKLAYLTDLKFADSLSRRGLVQALASHHAGTVLRRYDPTAFALGYEKWKSNPKQHQS